MTFEGDDTWTFEVIFHDSMHAPSGEPFRMVKVTNTRIKE